MITSVIRAQRLKAIRFCGYRLHQLLLNLGAPCRQDSAWIDEAISYLKNDEILSHIWTDADNQPAPEIDTTLRKYNYLVRSNMGIIEYLIGGAFNGFPMDVIDWWAEFIRVYVKCDRYLAKDHLQRMIGSDFILEQIPQENLKYLPEAIDFHRRLSCKLESNINIPADELLKYFSIMLLPSRSHLTPAELRWPTRIAQKWSKKFNVDHEMLTKLVNFSIDRTRMKVISEKAHDASPIAAA